MAGPTPVVTDFGQFTALRAAANRNDPQALEGAAKQFESLFVQMMLKSMREANLADDPLGQNGAMYRDLYDQQLAMQMSQGKGIGIADMLIRQLRDANAQAATAPPEVALKLSTQLASAPAAPLPQAEFGSVSFGAIPAGECEEVVVDPAAWRESQQRFVDDIRPHAEKAAAELGIPARVLVAQAALETGWGSRVMRHRDGTSSYNLFGIKAGNDWDGASVVRKTTEFRHGVAHRESASFRSYDSLGDAFADYASFIKSHPRYAAALRAEGSGERYMQELQKAGYATDPHYAHKVNTIACGKALEVAWNGRTDAPELSL